MQFAAAFSAVVGDGIDIGAQSVHLSLIVAVCSLAPHRPMLTTMSVCLLLTVHSLSFSDLFLLPMIYFSLSPFSFCSSAHIHLLLQLFLLLLLLFTKLTFFLLFSSPFTTSSVDSQSVSRSRVVWLPTPIPIAIPITSCI